LEWAFPSWISKRRFIQDEPYKVILPQSFACKAWDNPLVEALCKISNPLEKHAKRKKPGKQWSRNILLIMHGLHHTSSLNRERDIHAYANHTLVPGKYKRISDLNKGLINEDMPSWRGEISERCLILKEAKKGVRIPWKKGSLSLDERV
jgi:hypothetical protein